MRSRKNIIVLLSVVLQIRRGNRGSSGVIFLFLNKKHLSETVLMRVTRQGFMDQIW